MKTLFRTMIPFSSLSLICIEISSGLPVYDTKAFTTQIFGITIVCRKFLTYGMSNFDYMIKTRFTRDHTIKPVSCGMLSVFIDFNDTVELGSPTSSYCLMLPVSEFQTM